MIFDTKTRKGVFVIGSLAVSFFVLGIVVGHFSGRGSSNEEVAENIQSGSSRPTDQSPLVLAEHQYENYATDKWKDEELLIQTINDRIDPASIKEYHRYLTKEPHVAATVRDDELAHYIQNEFEKYGFDFTKLIPYNVLLTSPNTSNPNKIKILRGSENIFVSHHMEESIHPDDAHPNFVHAFNAFTPAATITTQPGRGLVYVNYGRIEDFKRLEELGVNVTGHIVIIRYGKIFRGNKVKHAQEAGAVGVILYSDPNDVATQGTDEANVYDKTFWLPDTGIQRGNTYIGEGDPLTPGWPSTEHAFRLSVEEANLHKIPAQPIGYGDAVHFLQLMDGLTAPEEWRGGIKNVSYKLGPLFLPQFSDHSIKLSTHNTNKISRSYNVLGSIKGSLEPDRYVMLGNHRDAWGYGAVDPSSGTAAMLEVARVFGTLLKEGWRPRRTIIFHSWGAEEHGVIGSTEFVEEYINALQERSVAYINADSCSMGSLFRVRATPLLYDAAVHIAPMVPGVKDSSKTLYDEWLFAARKGQPFEEKSEIFSSLGGGSDHEHFAFYAGIPIMDLSFRIDSNKYNITMYPAYHTGFDTFYLVSQFIDPDYKIIQGCGRMAALSLKYLADSSILPYGITELPKMMLKFLKTFSQKNTLINIYDKYVELEHSVEKLLSATKTFADNTTNLHSLTLLQQRAINDQLMKLEQIFILPEGLPGRSTVRSALFAASQHDNYGGGGFSGIKDLLYKYEELKGDEKKQREFTIKKHISDLTIMTDRATAFLRDVYKF